MYRTGRGELRCPSRSRVHVLSHRSTPYCCCHLVHLTDTGVFSHRKAKGRVTDQTSASRQNFSFCFLPV